MHVVLGARVKNQSTVQHMIDTSIDHVVYEAEPGLENASDQIDAEFIGYGNFFNLDFYKDIKVDKVINFRDQQKWLAIENKIATLNELPQQINLDTFDFYNYKSVQNDIVQELDIPVLETEADKIIVKLDSGYSGGNGFKVVERENYMPSTNEFTQRYIDIEYTLAIQAYADAEGYIYPYCFHRMDYENNSPTYAQSPYFSKETNLITEYLSRLKTKVQIKDRLIFWQFIRERNGKLYNLDFNCRPAGGFETGTYDTLIGDCNILDCYISNKGMPQAITFNKQVQIAYKYKQQFGYAPIDKQVVSADSYTYEVCIL